MTHFHRKFGHASKEKLIEIERQDPEHIKITGEREIECEVCSRQKMTASPYAKRRNGMLKQSVIFYTWILASYPKKSKPLEGTPAI